MRLMSVAIALLLTVLSIWGCQMRPGRGAAPVSSLPATESYTPIPPKNPVKPAPQSKVLPPLRAEPMLNVLLQRTASRGVLHLRSVATVAGKRLNPGRYAIHLRGQDIAIPSHGILGKEELFIDLVNNARSASFSLEPSAAGYGGDVVIKVVDGKLAICERLPLEDFLPGVLVKEMGDSWPLEALKAQAVAARSYIASQYLRRHDKPWHLAAAERVDLAYVGFVAKPHLNLQTALRQTRGDILVFSGLPLTAWFHSCSGGRTADKQEAFPTRMAADGVTDPAPAMPSVRDVWAAKGAVGLKRPRVLVWDFEIAGDALSWRIRKNATVENKRLGIGAIQRIDILSRHASGRAHQLAVTHNGAEGRGRWLVDAYQFRLWAGSHDIRSTWWTELGQANGKLRFAGKGFGHGVGMSQISAWAMAKEGLLASRILSHFYPGAQLVRRW